MINGNKFNLGGVKISKPSFDPVNDGFWKCLSLLANKRIISKVTSFNWGVLLCQKSIRQILRRDADERRQIISFFYLSAFYKMTISLWTYLRQYTNRYLSKKTNKEKIGFLPK